MMQAEVFYNSNGNLVFEPIIETADDLTKEILDNLISDDGDFQIIISVLIWIMLLIRLL